MQRQSIINEKPFNNFRKVNNPRKIYAGGISTSETEDTKQYGFTMASK